MENRYTRLLILTNIPDAPQGKPMRFYKSSLCPHLGYRVYGEPDALHTFAVHSTQKKPLFGSSRSLPRYYL